MILFFLSLLVLHPHSPSATSRILIRNPHSQSLALHLYPLPALCPDIYAKISGFCSLGSVFCVDGWPYLSHSTKKSIIERTCLAYLHAAGSHGIEIRRLHGCTSGLVHQEKPESPRVWIILADLINFYICCCAFSIDKLALPAQRCNNPHK